MELLFNIIFDPVYASTFESIDKFHVPKNQCLAMAGEIGELAEIFQWKGSMDNMPCEDAGFTQAQIVHIGEEISDVFVYCTRLCDESGVNVTAVMRRLLTSSNSDTIRVNALDCYGTSSSAASSLSVFNGVATGNSSSSDVVYSWDPLSFDEVCALIGSSVDAKTKFKHIIPNTTLNSPRTIIFQLLCNLGTIGAILSTKKEIQLTPNMIANSESHQFFQEWSDVREITDYCCALAEIFIRLSILCEYFHFKPGSILADKIGKNNKKYPADLVKGRSEKYTAYASQVAERQQDVER